MESFLEKMSTLHWTVAFCLLCVCVCVCVCVYVCNNEHVCRFKLAHATLKSNPPQNYTETCLHNLH